MSILDKIKKINTPSSVLVFSFIFFGFLATVGAISLFNKEKARDKPFLAASAIYGPDVEVSPQVFSVVASKNGKTYYLPSCGVVNRIKPENLVTFVSQHEAEAVGYVAAKNCAELKELNDL